MSGHSKWSTIKHKKAATDQKRGKLFSSLSKAIMVAVKDGGGEDPTKNPALKLAIDKARAANMPNQNVKRAIERALGKSGGSGFEEVIYEGYGPEGVGFMVVAKTDNRKRTSAELRYIFSQLGGNLGAPGSAAYLFERSGGEIKVKVLYPVNDQKVRSTIESLTGKLESHDDVEKVITNMD